MIGLNFPVMIADSESKNGSQNWNDEKQNHSKKSDRQFAISFVVRSELDEDENYRVCSQLLAWLVDRKPVTPISNNLFTRKWERFFSTLPTTIFT